MASPPTASGWPRTRTDPDVARRPRRELEHALGATVGRHRARPSEHTNRGRSGGLRAFHAGGGLGPRHADYQRRVGAHLCPRQAGLSGSDSTCAGQICRLGDQLGDQVSRIGGGPRCRREDDFNAFRATVRKCRANRGSYESCAPFLTGTTTTIDLVARVTDLTDVQAMLDGAAGSSTCSAGFEADGHCARGASGPRGSGHTGGRVGGIA
jgi:hypothetical protein